MALPERSRHGLKRSALPALLAAALVVAPPVPAQTPHASVAGIVTGAGGQRLSHVAVDVAGSLVAVTDGKGWFHLDSLSAGDLVFTLRAIGYLPLRLALQLDPGDQLTFEPGVLVLDQAVPVLDPVHVEGARMATQLERVGFRERERTGHGAYVDRAEIEEARAQDLTDILRRVPGVSVRTNKAHGRRSPLTGMVDTRQRVILFRGGCEPSIHIDGVHIGFARQFDVDLLVPWQDVEGIEVYRGPGEVPVRFRVSGAQCGALVFWMRQ